jgi:excisionase family DNA binding protein
MKRKVYKQIEVAKMIGVHRNSVYRWVRDGKINSVLVAGVRMIPASEIEKLTGEE